MSPKSGNRWNELSFLFFDFVFGFVYLGYGFVLFIGFALRFYSESFFYVKSSSQEGPQKEKDAPLSSPSLLLVVSGVTIKLVRRVFPRKPQMG